MGALNVEEVFIACDLQDVSTTQRTYVAEAASGCSRCEDGGVRATRLSNPQEPMMMIRNVEMMKQSTPRYS